MTATLNKLDYLFYVDEDHYYSDDLFLDAEELIAALSLADVPLLIEYWGSRSELWCERFAQTAADINQAVLIALLSAVIDTTPYCRPTLGLVTRLPQMAEHSAFYDSLLGYAEHLWRTQPELHKQIQMSCWSCGLSRRLLNRLGFQSWADATMQTI